MPGTQGSQASPAPCPGPVLVAKGDTGSCADSGHSFPPRSPGGGGGATWRGGGGWGATGLNIIFLCEESSLLVPGNLGLDMH